MVAIRNANADKKYSAAIITNATVAGKSELLITTYDPGNTNHSLHVYYFLRAR